jgi:hypothetical protein
MPFSFLSFFGLHTYLLKFGLEFGLIVPAFYLVHSFLSLVMTLSRFICGVALRLGCDAFIVSPFYPYLVFLVFHLILYKWILIVPSFWSECGLRLILGRKV